MALSSRSQHRAGEPSWKERVRLSGGTQGTPHGCCPRTNAIARFDQVEGVTDAERDRAWRRIRSAARKFGVDVGVRGWRQLFEGGKEPKR